MTRSAGPARSPRRSTRFCGKVLSDPNLAGSFERVDMAGLPGAPTGVHHHALGGPSPSSGRDMKTAHQPLGIIGAEFDAVVGHLGATLSELGVPADTIGTIGGALAPLRADIVA